MNILVTGAHGFVGKNLCEELKNQKLGEIFEYDLDTDPALLDGFTHDCDFVFHLAGVNRPKDEKEFMEGNFGFTSTLLENLKKHGNKAPIVVTSSIQAALDNPYGKSKKAGEDLIFAYGKDNSVKTDVYRFPNLFGKWCRPNYNSVIATFCYNIANNLPITISNRENKLCLVYIDDLVEEMINALKGQENLCDDGFCRVKTEHEATLGQIANLIYSFKATRQNLSIPDMSDAFTKKLYSTYLSYLPEKDFDYPLIMHTDDRGSFTEIIKTPERGQFSVNVAHPGITKGNHWHNTKNEKFCVVSGKGVIRFRKPDSTNVIEYYVSGDEIKVVDIPCGYTHNIENIGDTDLVTFMWCNELFDPDHPDTFFLKV